MGAKASKKETKVTEFVDSDSEHDYRERANNQQQQADRDGGAFAATHHPATNGIVTNNDDWSKRMANNDEEAKKKNIFSLGGVFGKGNRKIVDMDSSDSENESEQVHKKEKNNTLWSDKANSREIDKNVRLELNELESTFTKLGLNNGTQKDARAIGNGSVPQAHPSNGIHNPTSFAKSEIGLQAFSSRDGYNMDKPDVDRRRSTVKRGGNGLTFSWDERNFATREEDDWTISKVKIDGFDPDKFRKANSKSSTERRLNPSSEVFILQQRSIKPVVFEESGMPGEVPSYDPIEQQIMASIEKELGV